MQAPQRAHNLPSARRTLVVPYRSIVLRSRTIACTPSIMFVAPPILNRPHEQCPRRPCRCLRCAHRRPRLTLRQFHGTRWSRRPQQLQIRQCYKSLPRSRVDSRYSHSLGTRADRARCITAASVTLYTLLIMIPEGNRSPNMHCNLH